MEVGTPGDLVSLTPVACKPGVQLQSTLRSPIAGAPCPTQEHGRGGRTLLLRDAPCGQGRRSPVCPLDLRGEGLALQLHSDPARPGPWWRCLSIRCRRTRVMRTPPALPAPQTLAHIRSPGPHPQLRCPGGGQEQDGDAGPGPSEAEELGHGEGCLRPGEVGRSPRTREEGSRDPLCGCAPEDCSRLLWVSASVRMPFLRCAYDGTSQRSISPNSSQLESEGG